tara:strand:- start:494 stop:1219 length:726 start_codon:yes stop_codon:yes gene_type:complete
MKVYKMKDTSDKFTIKKSPLFDLPMRLLVIGRTGCGKSNFLGNLLLRSEAYRDDFLPENIYIFSGSLKGDMKLKTIIDELDIPESNLFDSFNEEIGHIIYDNIVEQYNDDVEDKQTPSQNLIIFDDLGFTNLMNKSNKNSILDRIFCNGRKYLISTITLNQKITQLSTTAREQCSGMVLYQCTNKSMEIIEQDFNYMDDKKIFRKMVRDHTQSKHNYMIVNFSQSPNIYQNEEFETIGLKK